MLLVVRKVFLENLTGEVGRFTEAGANTKDCTRFSSILLWGKSSAKSKERPGLKDSVPFVQALSSLGLA